MSITVRRLTAPDARQLGALCDVLIDCVEGGASVSFMLPMTRDKAERFWSKVNVGVLAGERALLVAEDASARIVGTAQLVMDVPENQPHRADVSKVLVHSSARRQGVADALMRLIDEVAIAEKRTVLVLDTVTGSTADRLYRRLGWQESGPIPDYALMPTGELCSTTYFYKHVRANTATSV